MRLILAMGAVLLLWRVGATALPFQEIPAKLHHAPDCPQSRNRGRLERRRLV